MTQLPIVPQRQLQPGTTSSADAPACEHLPRQPRPARHAMNTAETDAMNLVGSQPGSTIRRVDQRSPASPPVTRRSRRGRVGRPTAACTDPNTVSGSCPACLHDRLGRSGVLVDDASEDLAAADLGTRRDGNWLVKARGSWFRD
jgi:hypothetical protein